MISFLFDGGAGARNVGGRGSVLGGGLLIGHDEGLLSAVCAALVEQRNRALNVTTEEHGGLVSGSSGYRDLK